MNPIQEIASISKHLPTEVLRDINSRISDWLASGGNENDPYIKQQLRYAKRFVNETNKL
jgi:hypothetical protein